MKTRNGFVSNSSSSSFIIQSNKNDKTNFIHSLTESNTYFKDELFEKIYQDATDDLEEIEIIIKTEFEGSVTHGFLYSLSDAMYNNELTIQDVKPGNIHIDNAICEFEDVLSELLYFLKRTDLYLDVYNHILNTIFANKELLLIHRFNPNLVADNEDRNKQVDDLIEELVDYFYSKLTTETLSNLSVVEYGNEDGDLEHRIMPMFDVYQVSMH